MTTRAHTSLSLAFVVLAASAHAQDADDTSPSPARPVPAVTTQGALAPATTVFSSVAGEPTSAVPGLPGASFSLFDRPFASRNGNWVLTADTDLVTTEDEVLLLNGAVAAREGTAAPWAAGELHGTFDTRVGVNDAGEYAFSTNVGPATVDDDYVIKVSPGPVHTVVARESDPIAALPGVFYDDLIDSAVLVDDGRVLFSADGIDGAVTTATDEVLIFGNAVLAQEGVTIPTGQAGGATETWENFDLEDGWVSADGAHWIQLGDLTGATTDDDVAVVDGAVVLQENQIVPGSGFAEPIDASGIVNVSMDWVGNWYARGNNDITEQDWVVRNGVVIAAVGQPVVTGGTELYSDVAYADCFFAHTGNSNGDWVIGGVTDNADILLNGVLVLNGTQVVVRESDPIDLDNNGVFDDDAYFNTFGNDDLILTNDDRLLFTATIKDGTGTQIGDGFFDLSLVDGPTVYCTSKTSSLGCIPTIQGPTATASLSAGSNSYNVRVGPVPGGAGNPAILIYTTDGPLASPVLGSYGWLCITAGSGFFRVLPPVFGGGSTGVCNGQYQWDYGFYLATQTQDPNLVPGAQIDMQGWYRDPPNPGTANTSNAMSFVLVP